MSTDTWVVPAGMVADGAGFGFASGGWVRVHGTSGSINVWAPPQGVVFDEVATTAYYSASSCGSGISPYEKAEKAEPVTPAQAAEILREAARMLGNGKWVQGAYGDAAGRHCAVGALTEACMRVVNRYTTEPTRALHAWLTREGYDGPGGEGFTVPNWNDMPGRTADDVIHALEKAALMVEEQA